MERALLSTLIQHILDASGPMPDPAAHARYLAKLHEWTLKQRLAALLLEKKKSAREPVKFWRGNRAPAPAPNDFDLAAHLRQTQFDESLSHYTLG
jgi:hypothetical protein